MKIIKKITAMLAIGVFLVLPFFAFALISTDRIVTMARQDNDFMVQIMTEVTTQTDVSNAMNTGLLKDNQNVKYFLNHTDDTDAMKNLISDPAFSSYSAVKAVFEGSYIQGLAEAKINQLGSTPSGIVPCGTKASGYAPCTICHLFVGVKKIVDYIVYATMPLAAGMLVYGGLLMTLSGASEKNISAGQGILWKAFIGMLVVFGAWIIVDTAIKILAVQDSAIVPNVGWIENWGPWNAIPQCN